MGNSLTNRLTHSLSNTLIALALVTSVAASSQENIELTGEIKQGGLVVGKTLAQNTVTLNGKTISVSKSGDFTFGFSRDDKKSYQLVITSVNGDRVEKTLTPQKRSYNIQRIEGIKKSIMQPNPKSVARAKQDSKQVKSARRVASSLNYFSQGFIAPIKGTITGVYGSQRILNGKPKWPHYGLDFAADEGTKIKAMLDGTVTMAEPDLFYTGGTLIFDHGHGISTLYMHMKKILVKKGQKVKQGDVIGTVGSTGRVTGAHLDVRLNWFQTRLDPATVLNIKN